jgi:hypothetical protein
MPADLLTIRGARRLPSTWLLAAVRLASAPARSEGSGIDAAKSPIPGAPISASESGFVYAPEPAPLAGGLAALVALAALTRRR